MNFFETARQASPVFVIAASSLAAASMMPGNPATFAFGTFVMLVFAILAFRAPWPGLLAIFPLASSLHPTPAGMGMQEALFALLKRYGKALGLAGGLAVANLGVAMAHGVGLADWLRGLVPFLFIGLFIPVALALEQHPDRLRWLGASIGASIALLAGHIVIYYLANDLHRPYWVVTVDGLPHRVTGALASLHADAKGPMLDRVTVHIQGATDALLPVGIVTGLIVAMLARDRRMAGLGYALALLALTAALMTYVRSMLLSVTIVAALFMAQIVVSRQSVAKLLALVLGLVLFGAGVVAALNIESIWGYHVGRLAMAVMADDTVSSVTTRVEEYRIAWERFMQSPVLGNGLGGKHAIQFHAPGGWVQQHVAYIHNWPFYFLMTTGVAGFLAYAWVLLAPVFVRPRAGSRWHLALTVLRAAILTMALYGLFFAVFRLITFNLLLAAAWGVILAMGRPSRISSASA